MHYSDRRSEKPILRAPSSKNKGGSQNQSENSKLTAEKRILPELIDDTVEFDIEELTRPAVKKKKTILHASSSSNSEDNDMVFQVIDEPNA